MNLDKYYSLIEKVSYVEEMIRLAESSKDFLPLKLINDDKELEQIAKNYFRLAPEEDFVTVFMNVKDIHQLLDIKFSGEILLFHMRRYRSAHVLPNAHLIYSIKGGCALKIEAEEIYLSEGDTCLVASGIPHSYYNTTGDSITMHIALTAAFVGSILLPRLPQKYRQNQFFRDIVTRKNQETPFLFVPATEPEETTFLIMCAFYYHVNRSDLYEETVNNYIILFFIYILKSTNFIIKSASFPQTPPVKSIQQIQDYISDNCTHLTLTELARAFHFNPSYMSQYLKKKTGSNFSTLLQNARISLATSLLINSNYSIVDIADKAGYQNMNYFYKLFKKINHCSPSEYRQKFIASSERTIYHEDSN